MLVLHFYITVLFCLIDFDIYMDILCVDIGRHILTL